MKILITAPYTNTAQAQLRKALGEIVCLPWKPNGQAYNDEELIGLLRTSEADALITEHDTVAEKVIALYPDALSFDPNELWGPVKGMAKATVVAQPNVTIKAISASSQRDEIVLIDRQGKSLIGLSNHDNRGREGEDMIDDKHRVHTLTGHYPTAIKVVGF